MVLFTFDASMDASACKECAFLEIVLSIDQHGEPEGQGRDDLSATKHYGRC